jgi:hypothetical protein
MSRNLKVFCLLAAIFVSEHGVCADEVVSFSDQQLKGDLDGIPMHYINVQTREHADDADVDITLDGKVTESIWREVPAFDNMLVSVPGTGEKGDFPTETT